MPGSCSYVELYLSACLLLLNFLVLYLLKGLKAKLQEGRFASNQLGRHSFLALNERIVPFGFEVGEAITRGSVSWLGEYAKDVDVLKLGQFLVGGVGAAEERKGGSFLKLFILEDASCGEDSQFLLRVHEVAHL